MLAKGTRLNPRAPLILVYAIVVAARGATSGDTGPAERYDLPPPPCESLISRVGPVRQQNGSCRGTRQKKKAVIAS